MMAELIKTIVDFSDTAKECVLTAATGSDYFVLDNADQRVTVIARNTNATQNATLTIKAGDGKLSSKGDLSIQVAAGKSAVIPMSRVESARVKVTAGSDKGKVFVNSAADAGGSLANVLVAVLSVN
jgi:hypothetical protein